MDQDNSSIKQSQYGSIGATSSTSDNKNVTLNSGRGQQHDGVRPPPKPAMRQKTLRNRSLVLDDANMETQTQLESNNNNSIASDRSQGNEDNEIDMTANLKSFNNKRPAVAPASLSMSQVLQQQAINKELAERHRSLKRNQQSNQYHQEISQQEPESRTVVAVDQHAQNQDRPQARIEENAKPLFGFQNKAFKMENSETNSLIAHNKTKTTTQADDKQREASKMPDQNPLGLLIKRPSATSSGVDHHQIDVKQDANLTSAGEEDEIDESKLRPYPRKVFFIVANEFCERFSYYGLRTVLVLYFKSVLGMSDSQSTVNYHLFAALCYLTPLLGAILGDSVWGKFRTILYLSVVYFFGELILVASAIYWQSSALSNWLTLLGLLLIGLGTGGIKPCVSAFGGDQFLTQETKRRAAFFSIFYASINAGSLISMFVTPMLRSDVSCVGRLDCFPLAFGLPCLLMLISIFSFLAAKNHYTRNDLPEKNVIVAFTRCVSLALKRKFNLTSSSKLNHYVTTTTTTSGNQATREASTSSLELASQTSEHNATVASKRQHWIYLASDRYDSSSLEDFRSVLAILFLFIPIPIYWCLYDQQGSMWTLQAARMDGRVPGTESWIIQPDQISVANPILLLAAIPVFECFIYPSMRRHKLLRSPVSKITAGGFLAALTFVVSAAIQFNIQANTPPLEPPQGRAGLRLVNGLADCQLIGLRLTINDSNNNIDKNNEASSILPARQKVNLASLGSRQEMVATSSKGLNYKVQFQVASNIVSKDNIDLTIPSTPNQSRLMSICALDPSVNHELLVAPLANQARQLLFIEQGNGKLKYHLFNESWQLPEANRARVLLLYESFGPLSASNKRKFSLIPENGPANHDHDIYINNNNNTSTHNQNLDSSDMNDFGGANRGRKYQFGKLGARFGSVYMYEPVDFDVPPRGLKFRLQTNNNMSGNSSASSFRMINLDANVDRKDLPELDTVHLKPGTRNLIVIHQAKSSLAYFKHSVTQDNEYRMNILWQLIPYLMISMSEVLFSITGLEFSYSIAPDTMKSVILGAWFLTVAVGNILTVAVEAIHPFSDVAYDLLFYAALMVADMLLFMFIGLNFKPYKNNQNTATNSNRNQNDHNGSDSEIN